jgi:hypothetical protein
VRAATSVCRYLTSRREKVSKLDGGFLFADSRDDFGSVVAGRLGEYTRAVEHSAAFWIFCGKDDSVEPRQARRRGAHRTRLQGHPQCTAIETRSAQSFSGSPYRDNLRVGCGIIRATHRIGGFCDANFPARDHGPNRDLSITRCFHCQVERTAHRRRKREGGH